MDLDGRALGLQFLIRDRDSKFSGSFDEVFRSDGARVILTPMRAPNTNAFAERWIRTVRAECLDWMLILGRRHLDRVLQIYVTRYNAHRPHRALDLSAPLDGAEHLPLLANIALHVLDRTWTATSGYLGVLVRYADDLVVLCSRRVRAEEARRRVGEILGPLGLQLNPEKTRIVCLTKGKEGFDFLGFHCHKVESWRWRGRFYLQHWPSRRAMAAVRGRIRAATDRRFVGLSVAQVAENVSRVLRRWAPYYR